MELKKISGRIWYSMYEKERDRPCLGYIRGDRLCMAVDAGHSDAHVEEFYEALEENGLKSPDLTVLTHWHWDHTFGMHRISGLSIANSLTCRYLKEAGERLDREGTGWLFALDESIRKEYAGDRPVKVVLPDIVFEDRLTIDLGGISASLFRCVSPHTDDTTLVYVPEEKVLFVGDSSGGVFPTWELDPEKTRQYIGMLRESEAVLLVEGHIPALSKEELIRELEAEISGKE